MATTAVRAADWAFPLLHLPTGAACTSPAHTYITANPFSEQPAKMVLWDLMHMENIQLKAAVRNTLSFYSPPKCQPSLVNPLIPTASPGSRAAAGLVSPVGFCLQCVPVCPAAAGVVARHREDVTAAHAHGQALTSLNPAQVFPVPADACSARSTRSAQHGLEREGRCKHWIKPHSAPSSGSAGFAS